ncbi:hypothetical protein CO174_00150 [Candidatus Uhrbacteria bacterium CG_4_9_14_3_um_filter_50_9]|uniref:Uncharacterized protein n=1 Tax=Candidatus Uhrbacteria bacterium CG_4_9_14_3_um_filter_50_9 TaxID=1975035 RepID=A0A2M7XEY3_9BACT|nr:MAG: hypothetical protein CO174_00150 [Candidatus Uhrbacteria bacterium CG_4_9_14_3_um_filter_50_9]
MIALQKEGFKARVFVTTDERAVGVVLYEDDKSVGGLRIETTDSESALRQVEHWLSNYELELEDELETAVLDELETLERVRTEGADAVGWLGSQSDRRLPASSLIA